MIHKNQTKAKKIQQKAGAQAAVRAAAQNQFILKESKNTVKDQQTKTTRSRI